MGYQIFVCNIFYLFLLLLNYFTWNFTDLSGVLISSFSGSALVWRSHHQEKRQGAPCSGHTKATGEEVTMYIHAKSRLTEQNNPSTLLECFRTVGGSPGDCRKPWTCTQDWANGTQKKLFFFFFNMNFHVRNDKNRFVYWYSEIYYTFINTWLITDYLSFINFIVIYS